MTDKQLPLVSIIVPSYNQGQFVEDTILSILNQNYPNLEVIVMDGGSTDNTLEILELFNEKIAVFSGPDRGQTDAINKGFAKAKGEIVAWLNSDDIYLYEDTISYIVDCFRHNPEIDVLFGDYIRIDEANNFLKAYYVWRDYSFERLMRVCYISQPTVFFRKHVIEKCPLDECLHYGMDIDLWLQLGKTGCRVEDCGRFVAAERIHGNAKTVANPTKSFDEGVLIRKKYASLAEHRNILKISFLDKMGFVYFRLKALFAVTSFWIRRDTVVPLEYPGLARLIIKQFIRA